MKAKRRSSKNTELSMYGFNSNSPNAEHIVLLRAGVEGPRRLALMSGSWCKPSAMMPHSAPHGPSASSKRDQMPFVAVLRPSSRTKAETQPQKSDMSLLLHSTGQISHKANPASSGVEIDSASP